jgi:hypothetical protein
MRVRRLAPRPLLVWVAVALAFLAGCQKTEPRKKLLTIANARVTRTGERSFQVLLDYDKVNPGDLPYRELLVFPLLPLQLGGVVEDPVLSVGTWAVSMEVPPEVEFDWQTVAEDPECCRVLVKGLREDPESKELLYDIISNELKIPSP